MPFGVSGIDNRQMAMLNAGEDVRRLESSASQQESPFLDLTRIRPSVDTATANTFIGDSPDSWNTIYIGLIGALPGIAKVSGRIAIRKDRQRAAGKSGHKSVHLGYEPATIDITLRLWTETHWRTFLRLAEFIRPRKPKPGDKPPGPFQLSHPALAAYKISAVEFIEAGFPEPSSESPDILEVKLKAIEYFPPENAPAKAPTKAVPVAEPGNAVDKKTNPTQANFQATTAAANQPAPPSQTSSGPNQSLP